MNLITEGKFKKKILENIGGDTKMRSTLYPKLFFLKLFILLTISQGVFANITILNVTNAPDTTNYYARYQITSSTGNGNTDLAANTDSIFVVFNASTTVPESIDPSLITVNSFPTNVVSISGQRLAILTPVNIAKNGGIFVVVIDANADIRNPSSSGSYTLQAATSKETTLITSSSYLIYQSISTVTAAAVSPNPSVEGNAAAYTIGFDVGSGGFLTASQSTITAVFPSETTVPNGALSGVTVNSTSASAIANNNTVVITPPVNVDNNGSVQINFAIGAGLENPTTAGSYTLAVKTSSENTLIDSDTYAISAADQLSISAITTKPDTVNEGGEFQFDFVTGTSGALSATLDTIVVIFQQNTFLPSSISSSNVTVSSGGFSDNATSVIVKKASVTDDDSVFVVTPIDIGNSADVTLTLSSGAGYLNPSVAGNYTMKLRTSQETTVIESNPYSVFNTITTVSQANVTPGDNSTGATTSYSINFNVGDLGRLKSDQSTITLSFNSLFGISETDGDYNASKMVIGGTDTISIFGGTDIDPDNIAKTIQVTVPLTADINNGDNIVLIFDGTSSDPITNPTASSNYVLGVKTSVETTNINSATYNIGGTSITINSVTLSDATVNNSSQYTLNITTPTKIQASASDFIKIIFPEGTTLPGTIATTNMTINGINPSSISVNQSAKSVTANVSQNNLPTGSPFDVIILSAANVINPTVPNPTFYKVTMHTSKDQNPVTSVAYAITGDNTLVTAVSASANPSVTDRNNVAYTVNFTTSATGKIVGGTAAGSSTITLDFDDLGTSVPTTITASAVEVNSNSAQSVNVLTSGSGGVVEVTMPNGLTIGNSSAVTVDFDTSAGLDNLSQEGLNTIYVKTSSDTSLLANGNYSLSGSSPLSVTSVTPNPTAQNANAGYSVKFTIGDPAGALSAGADSIRIVFPSNTQIPASVSLNDVTVNGTNPATNPRVGASTLVILVPLDLTAGAAVTVLINQSAGFLNPTLVQSYTLEVNTTQESGLVTSPAYNITQTSSTVSAATITVETPTPALTSKYTIDFNVGSNGRLLAGTSTITITFNGSTTVDPTPGNYDITSIVADAVPTAIPTTDISISGQAVTLTIPSTVSVDNNDNVSIILDGTVEPITNPSSSSEYTLEVKTSVETSNITSNSYTISSDSPVTNITLGVDSDIVNDVSTDTVSFRAQSPLSAGSGTITITFPSNTLIPSSISTAFVKVANDGSDPQTFNNAAGVSTNPSTRTVTVTVPSGKAVIADDSVRVAFLTLAGIENPSISGDYTLNVKTSSQGLNGTSAAYNLVPTLTTILNLSVDITPVAPSEIGRYEYNFATGIRGRLVSGNSTITLLIPYDVVFTLGTPLTSKVTVNSTAAAAVVLNEGTSPDPHELIITVPSSVTIGNNTDVTVVIDGSAGLQNSPRTIPLFYNVYTSVETASVQTDFSLPVELSSFQSESKNNMVILSWVTESELDNAFWWILRKEVSKDEYNKLLNGSLIIGDSKNKFETVNQIEGRGNTSEKSFYEYEDNTVEVGKIYAYRLVDVSYSGLTTYHDVIYQEVKAPMIFALEQNFPNPFNPSTNIKYSIPVEAAVEMRIFNILGQEVKTLIDQITKPGFYNIEWDGKDDFNQRVASGMYIYSFIVKSVDGNQSFKQVRKMLLIK